MAPRVFCSRPLDGGGCLLGGWESPLEGRAAPTNGRTGPREHGTAPLGNGAAPFEGASAPLDGLTIFREGATASNEGSSGPLEENQGPFAGLPVTLLVDPGFGNSLRRPSRTEERLEVPASGSFERYCTRAECPFASSRDQIAGNCDFPIDIRSFAL